MSQRVPWTAIFLLLVAALTLCSAELPSSIDHSDASSPLLRRQPPPISPHKGLPKYTCVDIGECLPCSVLQKETMDHCKETGNRLRIECHFDDPADQTNEEIVLQLPTFRSCLRVKAIESRRFAHFMSTNIFIALFSGILLVWRRRKLAAAQYRRMARRIGLV